MTVPGGKGVSVPRWALLLLTSLVISSCALRPATVRNVTIVESEVAEPGEPSSKAQVARRSASEFERHTFAVADNQSVVGTLLSMPIAAGETLSDVARHFGLGYEEIVQANPDIDPWVPAAGSEVLVPQLFVLPRSARRGIVINLAAMRLFRFKAGDGGVMVSTYPVGIGREGKSTPTGTMAIARKTKDPAWYPTKNILADHAKRGDPLPAMVPAGPDNPLGAYAMYLTKPSYLIHGTNKPFSVGLRASNGCIRLYPENIEPLFGATSIREPVQIVNQPYLYGWRGEVLYLQAYPPHEELNEGALRAGIEADLKELENSKHHPLDWNRIARVLREARGIPMPISQGTPEIGVFLASAVPVSHPGQLFGKPPLPDDDAGGWRVSATDTASEMTARRVAAVLNHQGPPIPARAVEVGERYQVIAGPFPDAKAAKVAAHRIRSDLELDPKVLAPEDAVAGTALPVAATAMPAVAPVAVTGGSSDKAAVGLPPRVDAAIKEDRGGRGSSSTNREPSDNVPARYSDPEPAAAQESEPVWREVPVLQESPPAEPGRDAVAEPSTATPALEELPASPDPYDPAAWSDAEPETVPPADTETEAAPSKRKSEDDESADDGNNLELRPLEYPPVIYAPPGYSVDPIHFTEPGTP